MRYLIEHVAGLLAAVLAAFFILATVHYIAAESVIPGIRSHVTFLDTVNTAVRIAPWPLLLASFVLLIYLASYYPAPQCKGARLTFVIIFLAVWLPIFAGTFLSPFLQAIGSLPTATKGTVGMIVAFGATISLIIALVLPTAVREDALEFFFHLPVMLAPMIILAMVSMAEALETHSVKECTRPHTVVYHGAHEEPTSQTLCPVALLERGMLFYDNEARATTFIPWAQLSELTRPAQRR